MEFISGTDVVQRATSFGFSLSRQLLFLGS
ncbi:hypothetical protein NC651_030751 [Populus alba x Populus x berolinensis]|nr:hypothetical protein NC651_030751 [Populus alba x Populus x berolinensis]